MALSFGLFSTNAYACSYPEAVAGVARAAEAAGFESLWTRRARRAARSAGAAVADGAAGPVPRSRRRADLLAAADDQRVRLGTGIIILPQRNPLVLAKELASLDVALERAADLRHRRRLPEARVRRARRRPSTTRAPRTDEYLDAMRAIWTSRSPPTRAASSPSPASRRIPRPVQQPASADRHRRPTAGGLPPRRRARPRLVRLRARPGRDRAGARRPARGRERRTLAPGASRAARDQHHARRGVAVDPARAPRTPRSACTASSCCPRPGSTPPASSATSMR